jgi:hypothetical protein
VEERQREQIGRIVVQCSTSARASFSFTLSHARDEFREAGREGSGAEMVAVVAAMGRDTDLLLSRLVSQIAPVSRTPAAFEEIKLAIRRWLRACDDELREVARTSRSFRLQERGGAALEIGRTELGKLTEAVERRLEIEKYDFEEHASSKMGNKVVESRKGGRPPAEFWDDMWAAIATALYSGELKPKSQADIQRAMAEWIEGKGHSAADSTVKGRARRLWDLIEVLDE